MSLTTPLQKAIKFGDIFLVAQALKMEGEIREEDMEFAIKQKKDIVFKFLYELCDVYGVEQNKERWFLLAAEN